MTTRLAQTLLTLVASCCILTACSTSRDPGSVTAAPSPASPALTSDASPGPNASQTYTPPPILDSMAPEPTLTAFGQATGSTDSPMPMPDGISETEMTELSRSDQTRVNAESFAVGFAQFQTDARSPRDPDALSTLISATMSAKVRLYLDQDFAGQREAETQSRHDAHAPVWLRSRPDGPPDAPTAVSVELADTMTTSSAWGGPYWIKTQLRVVWESGAWKLQQYAGGYVQPSKPEPGTPTIRSALTGAGWRRLPTAGPSR
jgi:hypothetical protein